MIGNIQRIISCSNSFYSCPYLCTRFGRAVSVAVILVRKREQHIFPCFRLQAADISISVIGISRLHAVAIADMADTVQGIISVAYFQPIIVVDPAPASENVVLITGTYSRWILDLRNLPHLVIGIGNQTSPTGTLFFQIALCVINILIRMPVTNRTGNPAQAVVLICKTKIFFDKQFFYTLIFSKSPIIPIQTQFSIFFFIQRQIKQYKIIRIIQFELRK